MLFSDWFAEMCNKNSTSPSIVAENIGVSPAAASYWIRNRSVPKKTTLAKIESFFGEKYSPDSKIEKEKSPTSEDVELDELGQELVELLIKLTPDEERQVYSFVQGLLAARKV